MGHERLKQEVCAANRRLVDAGLVVLTWGNVSGLDREAGALAIKPSGVDYGALQPDDIVIVDLGSGEVREGRLKPSSDTPTHRYLYQAFPEIVGVAHTHSLHATAWAQAARDLPCFGTTHADHFHGPVPVTEQLTAEEVEADYEANTGKVIVRCFAERDLSPGEMPAVLVRGHAPFTWGPSVTAAVDNAIALEAVARLALETLRLSPDLPLLPTHLLEKHFSRKHGAGAYYGQKG
jgi:L-ribulose-5-phosphate 4-epimerase